MNWRDATLLLLVVTVWCTPTMLQHVFMRSGSLIDETKASAVNDRRLRICIGKPVVRLQTIVIACTAPLSKMI